MLIAASAAGAIQSLTTILGALPADFSPPIVVVQHRSPDSPRFAYKDGTDGVQTIKAHGGVVIVQDARTSADFGMPGSAIETGAVDYVAPVDEIAPLLVN